MPTTLRMKVNGPALLNIGPQASTQLTPLGLSDKGVRMRIQITTQDVETDASGPTPADTQRFPDIAFISFRLVTWDDTALNSLFSTNVGSIVWTPGETLPPGVLLGPTGGYKTVRIDSPYGDLPYVFNFCHLIQEKEVNLGTERSGWQITLRALPGIGVNIDPGGFTSDANLTRLYYRPSS